MEQNKDTEFTLVTYNVHSCIGLDRRTTPSRIAEVIARQDPDVVALQELDVELERTGLVDQAEVISEYLKMDYHFHPSLHIERGQYGNAVLSGHPMRLVRAGQLPTLPKRRELEKRGALWVEVDIGGRKIQVINTHMGLNRSERLAQVTTLMGPDWLGSAKCVPPIVLCGDFNAPPFSSVYRRLKSRLLDTQRCLQGHRPERTWPGWFPILRLDYVFITGDIRVRNCMVSRTALSRVSSDHLPLRVRLQTGENEGDTERET